MALISFDNGKHLLTAQEARDKLAKKKLWDKTLNVMDGEIIMRIASRDDIGMDMNNIDNRVKFVDAYLRQSFCDLIV